MFLIFQELINFAKRKDTIAWKKSFSLDSIKIRSWSKITENNIKNEKNESPKYETLDELIALLLEVRVDLAVLCKSVDSENIKEELKWAVNGIDIVGCGLCQNISIE